MSDFRENEDRFAVALTLCFYCQESNEIVINSRLTKNVADKVKEMDGKVISMQPCSKCEEHMKQGVILITFDPEKSDTDWHMPPKNLKEGETWMPNPYRSGGIFVVRDEAVRDMIDDEGMADWAIKHRWLFMEHEVAVTTGLFEIASRRGGEDAP